MQTNQKKVKTLIVCSILAIVALLAISIALIVNINLAKKELAKQQQQIELLQKEIEHLNNPASDNDETISPGGN